MLRRTPPTQRIFYISVALAIISVVLRVMATRPTNGYLMLLIGYLVLLAGNVLEGV